MRLAKLSIILILAAWIAALAAPAPALADHPAGNVSGTAAGVLPETWPTPNPVPPGDNRVPADNTRPEAVISELNFDAGFVDKGQVVKHDFMVKNQGDGLLLIENVTPG